MTTAELNAIYAPAFDAAGDRPTRGGLVLEFGPLSLSFAWSKRDEITYIDPEDAANACRCWAENWLMREAGEITAADHSRTGGVARVTLGDTRLTCSKMWAGDTIHHALAAAVIAVAKAKEKA